MVVDKGYAGQGRVLVGQECVRRLSGMPGHELLPYILGFVPRRIFGSHMFWRGFWEEYVDESHVWEREICK